MKHQRNHLIMLIFLVVLSHSATSQELFKKVSEDATDKSIIELATKTASSFFDALKQGNYFDFSDVATKIFSDSMTPAVQKQTYSQLKNQFGEYESLTYSETWVTNDIKGVQVIRFKGNFENITDQLEIRVVLDSSNRIAGLWVKLWKDNLNNS